jgi:radical SAM/Cys-rich protein
MSQEVIRAALEALRRHPEISAVDLTGGAPELHPEFEDLVESCRALGKRVVVRHNLTVTLDGDPLTKQPKDHLPAFFAANRVEILASLPSIDAETTDGIRGKDVFNKSIESLQRLAMAGYGGDPELCLKVVTNVDGPLSPCDRASLERRFKSALAPLGIGFDELLTVTNMLVGRYAEDLQRDGQLDGYLRRLADAASGEAATEAVCRFLVNVGIDGRLYDCDFNQAVGLPIGGATPATIFDFDYAGLMKRQIAFARHCFGCSAGAGSG